MNKKRVWWIAGILVVLLIIIIAVKASSGNHGIKVAVDTVATHTITETVTASGKIYPETEVKIAPEVSGEITQLTVQEGDSVQRGQLLVKINPAIYNSIVSQAQASVQQSEAGVSNTQGLVAQAKSQYDLALATYNRNKKLFDKKVISQLEFEQAEASFASAKAAYESAVANSRGGGFGVKGAQAGLSQAQENLLKTTIVAPTAGVISQLNVKQGERVVGTAQMAGTEMLTIADMSRLEVRVDISETDIAKVKLGDTAVIDAEAYRNRHFKGIVSKVAVSSKNSSAVTASNDQVSNYTVHILILPESYGDLVANRAKGNFIFKPGMSANVEIQTRREPNILSIPVNAVTTRDWPDSIKTKRKAVNPDAANEIRQVVFVYNAATKQVTMRDVATGIQDNEHIQITSGLKQGEQVIIAPYGAITRTLNDKDKVQVVKKEDLFEEKATDE